MNSLPRRRVVMTNLVPKSRPSGLALSHSPVSMLRSSVRESLAPSLRPPALHHLLPPLPPSRSLCPIPLSRLLASSFSGSRMPPCRLPCPRHPSLSSARSCHSRLVSSCDTCPLFRLSSFAVSQHSPTRPSAACLHMSALKYPQARRGQEVRAGGTRADASEAQHV
jgi:hypothetical protein